MPYKFDTIHHSDTAHHQADSTPKHQPEPLREETVSYPAKITQQLPQEIASPPMVQISDSAKVENDLFQKLLSEPVFFHLDEFKLPSDSISTYTELQTTEITVSPSKPTGKTGTPLPQSVLSNPVIPISLFAFFLLFIYILTHGRKVIGETLKEFFFLKVRSSIFFETTANLPALRNSFVLLFVGGVSLFLFAFTFETKFELHIAYLGIIALGLLLFLSLKLLLFKFLGYIFFDRNHTEIFTRGYFTILFALGGALIPVDIALVYMPQIFHTTIIIIGLLLFVAAALLIFYKIIQIFLDRIASLFYIMLYLCTLEILPILIVLKIIG